MHSWDPWPLLHLSITAFGVGRNGFSYRHFPSLPRSTASQGDAQQVLRLGQEVWQYTDCRPRAGRLFTTSNSLYKTSLEQRLQPNKSLHLSAAPPPRLLWVLLSQSTECIGQAVWEASWVQAVKSVLAKAFLPGMIESWPSDWGWSVPSHPGKFQLHYS